MAVVKNIALSLFLCGIFVSCTDPTHFTIKGTLDSSLYGDAIYLCTIPDADTLATGRFTDSTSFIVEGNVQEPSVVFLKSSSRRTTPTFVLEKGNMKVHQVNDSTFLVKGTPLNDIYTRFQEDMENSSPDSVSAATKELMIENSSNALGTMLGRSLAYGLQADEYVELYDRMDNYMRRDSFFVNIYKRASRRQISVGSMFSEIIGEVDGRPARLSEYAGRGSWVLLSFWASWCRDCSKEMPRLRAMYDSLKRMDTEIIGISRNDKPEKMAEAMRRYDMVWPVFCNTNSREAYSYGIVTIPSLILIDPDGVVVATGTTCNGFLGKIRRAQAKYKAR